jgi:hypothetical protein
MPGIDLLEDIGVEKTASRHFREDVLVRHHALLLGPAARALPGAREAGFPQIDADRLPDNIARIPSPALDL